MSTLPMIIDSEWLETRDACKSDYDAFCAEWPNGAEVSILNLNRASELKVDLEWLAQKMLPRALYDDYEAKYKPIYDDYYAKRLPIIAEYDAKRAPIKADYHAKCAPFTDEYYAKRALFNNGNLKTHYPITVEYEAELEPFTAEYEAKCAPLSDEFEAKCAPLTTDYESKRDSLLISAITAYYESEGYKI